MQFKIPAFAVLVTARPRSRTRRWPFTGQFGSRSSWRPLFSLTTVKTTQKGAFPTYGRGAAGRIHRCCIECNCSFLGAEQRGGVCQAPPVREFQTVMGIKTHGTPLNGNKPIFMFVEFNRGCNSPQNRALFVERNEYFVRPRL